MTRISVLEDPAATSERPMAFSTPFGRMPSWRAPVRALACPSSRRLAVRGPSEAPAPHRRVRAFGPRHKDEASRRNAGLLLTTDYWNPPTSKRQHARQRVLALILAVILAVLLAQVGW
jgi:hypothetical protein